VSSAVPLYVLRIEAESGQVTVGPREALEQRTLTASAVNWTGAEVPHEWRAVQAIGERAAHIRSGDADHGVDLPRDVRPIDDLKFAGHDVVRLV